MMACFSFLVLTLIFTPWVGGVPSVGSSRPSDCVNVALELGAAGGCIPRGSSLAGGLLLLHTDMSGQQLEMLCGNIK